MSDEQPPPGSPWATDDPGSRDVGPAEQTRLGERRRLRRERSQSEAESLAQRLVTQRRRCVTSASASSPRRRSWPPPAP